MPDEGEWEAVGPWQPTNEDLADAVRAAWSIVRLQWEGVAHGDATSTDAGEAQIAIYEEFDARTLVVGLSIVGGILAMSGEIMLGFPGAPMDHDAAHEETRRRLMEMHAQDWPEAWD